MSDRATMWGAFSWGFAEATLFFIVPDVLLTWRALDDLRGALRACLAALLGALPGGALMWAWGRADIESAQWLVELVPAVGADMMDEVRHAIAARGAAAVLLGPLVGEPYKVYAIQCGAGGVGLLPFLIVSVPARLARFLLLTFVAAFAARFVPPLRARRVVLATLWLVFYMIYFLVVPW